MDDSALAPPAGNQATPLTDVARIDAQLLELIGQRLRAADQAGGEPAGFRPARDLQVMRRLLAAAPAHVDPDLIQEIWRALLGASVRRHAQLDILAAGGAEPAKLFDLARRHFGASARIQRMDDARAALSRALDHANTVCVLPWIGKTGAGMWWPILAETRFSALNIVAALPMRANGEAEPDAALVSAHIPMEPAGGDISLAIAFDPKFKLQRALSEAGLKGVEIVRASSLVLLRIDGHMHADDLRPALLSKAGLDGFRIVGSYARI